MKPLSLFLISCFTALSVFAQQSNITVNIALNGNQNREVIVDGNTYLLTDYATGTNTNTITITNLAPGQHTMQVVRTTASNTRRNVGTERAFNLRPGYDLDIVVNGNGTVQLTEKRIRNRNRGNINQHTAMSTTNFNLLVKDISRLSTNSSRVTAINNAFANTKNYFSTAQVSQLVRMITGDANRISLLKSSYRSVVDPNGFDNLLPLVSTRAGRDDVAAYVNNYNINNPSGTNPNTGYSSAMPATQFNQLMTQVRNESSTEGRVSVIYNSFTNSSNYFSTDQVRRLIQMITGEANILHLAKASYRSVTDKNNFQVISNLVPTQVGRNDLANYVNTYNPSVVYSGTVPGSSTYHNPMDAASFSTLLNQIRSQWLPGAKKVAVINAFNAGNYFTTAQALELIKLDNDEPDRLEMAKASYKTIVDPNAFYVVYNLFANKAYRDELTLFVRNYTAGSDTSGTTSTGYHTAMSDTEFTTLYNNIRGQWLPGAKKAAVINAFTSGTNYFTSQQASLLVQLDSDEPDRLDMAKAAYKAVVDPNNFDVLYNLFTTQAYKDALTGYVNANK